MRLNVQKLLDVVDELGQDSDKQKIRDIKPRISNGIMERATGLEPGALTQDTDLGPEENDSKSKT